MEDWRVKRHKKRILRNLMLSPPPLLEVQTRNAFEQALLSDETSATLFARALDYERKGWPAAEGTRLAALRLELVEIRSA